MPRRYLAALVLLFVASPLAAQRTHTFAYGAGAAATGEGGLHIAASLEPASAEGIFGRRLEVMLHDRDSRDLFVLANLVYRPRPGTHSPYALAGVGAFTGSQIPLAANAGVGIESTLLSAAPLFVEARLLYTAEVYARTRLGIQEKELFPSITLGVRLAGR
jgi:hypothetical protein